LILPLPAYLLSSFFAPREVLAVLEAVGAIADPVRGEDKFAAIAAAVVVVVMPVLAQQNAANRKAQHLLGRSTPRPPQKTIQDTHPMTFISPRRPDCLTAIPVIEGHQRCALQFQELW
jgi:hypothetical protein